MVSKEDKAKRKKIRVEAEKEKLQSRDRRDLALTRRGEPGKIIVATGRGGTGKTTFVALASRYLQTPLLLLDIDPDQSLADMVGVDLEKTRIETEIGRKVNIKTASDIIRDLEQYGTDELVGGPVEMRMQFLLEAYTVYKSKKFDLISMGPRWEIGDYAAANYLFEFVIPSFGGGYNTVAVDSPAGLEHLNRKVISKANDFFVVLDPSHKSLKHIERVKKIINNVGLKYDHIYAVGNHEFNDEAAEYLRDMGELYLGKMDFDPMVKDYNLKGKSLLDLPDSSPACLSVKRILSQAGYVKD